MKEDLIKAFNYNKCLFDMYYNYSNKEPEDKKSRDYLLATAELFGKCKMIACILAQNFSYSEILDNEIPDINKKYKSLY